MADSISIHDFTREVECTHKGELYSVRDNGAVLKYPQAGNRPRPTDNQWTFGKLNEKTGYMEIAGVRVHRIVATAFHGEPPSKEHVVDHIDTNKRNNRRENLRWVTRLENVLLNPITANRIANVCGSVEAFLSNPQKYRDKFPEPNYQWMGTVSKEEAKTSLERMLAWAENGHKPSGGSLGDWIFSRNSPRSQQVERALESGYFEEALPLVTDQHDRTPKPAYFSKAVNRDIAQHDKISEFEYLTEAINLNAAQRNWSVPSEFPCCPQESTEEPISAYADRLRPGLVFCRNDIYSSLVSKSVVSEDRQSLYVLTESTKGKAAIKPYALAKVTHEKDLFVHTSLGNFFTQVGAEKQFCLAQGLEWSGEDSVDDYC